MEKNIKFKWNLEKTNITIEIDSEKYIISDIKIWWEDWDTWYFNVYEGSDIFSMDKYTLMMSSTLLFKTEIEDFSDFYYIDTENYREYLIVYNTACNIVSQIICNKNGNYEDYKDSIDEFNDNIKII